MAYPTNKHQYDKRALKDYIKYYYLQAEDLSKILFYDDPGDHHLGDKFRGLGNIEFETKIIETINFAERRGKYNKLVELLKADNKTNFDTLMRQFMKPFMKTLSSEQLSVELAFSRHNNESWGKSNKISNVIKSSTVRPNMSERKNVNEVGKPPQIGKLPPNIERLGLHITLLGEIDNLLEGLRKKIGELKNVNEQYQAMLNETMNAARKPNLFQGKQKANFQVSRSAITGQQLFQDSNRGWRETQYPKS